MSEEKKESPQAQAPAAKKPSFSIVGVLLPALLAGGAAFGAIKFTPAPKAAPAEPAHHETILHPPGPTLALDPFLVTTMDNAHKTHAMKVTLAVEFDAHTKEETLKPLVPRLRDATLTYLRALTFEEVVDQAHADKARQELLEKFVIAGATGAQRVLVTDLVVQ